MTKREKLLQYVKALGYELEGSETVAELKEIKKELEKENPEEEVVGSENDSKKKVSKIYLWLKTRAYVAKDTNYMGGWPENEATYEFEQDGDSLTIKSLTFAIGFTSTLRQVEGTPNPW